LVAEVYNGTVNGGKLRPPVLLPLINGSTLPSLLAVRLSLFTDGAQVKTGTSTQAINQAIRTWNLFGRSAWTGIPTIKEIR